MDEMEGAEIIETHEAHMEDIPLPVAPLDKSAIEMASARTPVPEVLPAAEVAVIEHVTTAEPISIETPQGEIVKSEVNITTSASAGKNCSTLI